MSRTMMVAGALALTAPSLGLAQTVRWNDRPTGTWSDEAPRVRVSIDGDRSVISGTPMRVRFEVSDNAFVAVVSVGGDGRMQILHPQSRTQRAAVRGGQIYYARNPRLGGEFSFVASGQMGGYVFAVASYAPLDFSTFENRDWDRIGGWSHFTVDNRSIARRPDVFIERFAARVLWDASTPYDYDVDYYFPTGYPSSAMSAYALCGTLLRNGGSAVAGVPWWRLVDFDLTPYPLRSMCRDFYRGVYCYSSLSLVSYACNTGVVVATGPFPPGTGQPTDSATIVPNDGVVRGGLFAPTPVPVPVTGPDAPPMERPGRFDQPGGVPTDWDGVMSIPVRATRKLKAEDARKETGSATGSAGATRASGFDRVETGNKEKPGVADNRDAAARVPPPREPTKAKPAGEPRRETGSRTGFANTGRTSSTGADKPDRVSRPTTTGSSGSTGAGSAPATVQGSTTEKKKPPM